MSRLSVLALASLCAASPALAGDSIPPELVGTYEGTHPHWTDTVMIEADGTFRRGNGDPGKWSFEDGTLVLAWEKWAPELLSKVGPGKYTAKKNGFTLVLRPAAAEGPPITGKYEARHGDWQDVLMIDSDGTFRRSTGDGGTWTYEGKTLVLAWQKGRPEILTRVGVGTFKVMKRGPRFMLTRIGNKEKLPVPAPLPPPVVKPEPPPVEKKPEPPPKPRDCGTGADDAGCQELKAGKPPMDKEEFEGVITALEATRNELTRQEQAGSMLGESVMTARQFGKVIALFRNELTRMEVVEALAKNMVDPRRALKLAATFKNSITAREYTEHVSSLK